MALFYSYSHSFYWKNLSYITPPLANPERFTRCSFRFSTIHSLSAEGPKFSILPHFNSEHVKATESLTCRCFPCIPNIQLCMFAVKRFKQLSSLQDTVVYWCLSISPSWLICLKKENNLQRHFLLPPATDMEQNCISLNMS